MSEGKLQELDRELARMAQETPEMPEDFHARWTAAIRAEARKTAGQADSERAETKTRAGRKEPRRQIRYILSAAAVFVFLIAGTMLTRNQERTRPAETGTALTSGAVSSARKAADEAEPMEAEAAEAPVMFAMEEAAEEDAAWDWAADEAPVMAAAPDAYEAEEEEAWAADDDVPAMAALPAMTAAPAPAATGTTGLYAANGKTGPAEAAGEAEEAEAAEEAEEEEETPQNPANLGKETVAFLKDMGAFALRMIPWVLGAAGLALLAAVIDRMIREKRKGRK